MNKAEPIAFIWQHQPLIVGKPEEHEWAPLLEIAPELEVCRTFNRPFDDLFQTDISQPVALHRRSRRLNHFDGHNHSFLQPAVKNWTKNSLRKWSLSGPLTVLMVPIIVLRETIDPSECVGKLKVNEASSTGFNKRLWHNLYARMLKHPLFEKHGCTGELHDAESEEVPLKMVA